MQINPSTEQLSFTKDTHQLLDNFTQKQKYCQSLNFWQDWEPLT